MMKADKAAVTGSRTAASGQYKAVRTCSGKDPHFNGALVLNGRTVVTQFTAETPEEAEVAWKNAQESARQYNAANNV